MLPIKEKNPAYLHYVDIFDLPEEHQTLVRDISQRNEYRMFDYSDGDYYYLIDLSIATKDPTPTEALQAFLDGRAEEAEYPFKDWQKLAPSDADHFEYVYWLSLVRYMVGNLPEEIVTQNKLAINVWH